MLAQVLDWVYPPKCGLCGRLGEKAVCSICLGDFQHLDSCSPEEDLEVLAALFHYEGRASQAIRRLKYSRVTSLADPLAQMMREGFDQFGLDEYDLIVPVPIHWRRRCSRGFNQAELLASPLPREKVRPSCLQRVRFTKPQVGLNREQRIRNLSGAFRASTEVEGKSVLLIDDVATTGRTGQQCARTLLEAGATRVGMLALTREL